METLKGAATLSESQTDPVDIPHSTILPPLESVGSVGSVGGVGSVGSVGREDITPQSPHPSHTPPSLITPQSPHPSDTPPSLLTPLRDWVQYDGMSTSSRFSSFTIYGSQIGL